MFLKNQAVFKKGIFDQWMLQLLSNLGKQKVMSLTLNLLDSFLKLFSVVMFACFEVRGKSSTLICFNVSFENF